MIEKGIERLIDFIHIERICGQNSKLYQELTVLAYGRRSAVKEYYVKKIRMVLAILAAGVPLAVLCVILERGDSGASRTTILERPGYGEGDRLENLEVLVEGAEEKQEMEVTVQERTYTDRERKSFMEQALEELEQVIAGKNVSMDEVRSDLVLPDALADGVVKISWITIPYGIVSEDGSIVGAPEENGTLVELQGTMSCGPLEQVYTAYAKIYPPKLSEKEQLKASIKREVEQADAEESHEEVLHLPEQIDGKNLVWNKAEESYVPSVLAMVLVSTVCVYVQMDNEVHKKAEGRKNQLILDYPDLMWKMTMLLGAGLSIRGVFMRIAQEYQKKEKKETRWLYEEVCSMCYEMQSGISEAQAYERFGKRCQLPEYIRLGTVLSQNLKKGSKGLTSLLEQEAESSMNERKNHARKIGEQAGTKLLLPMVLMLGIVLVILMVPAFLAF